MMSLPEPFVSIVTPIHNEAKFLAECIESVLDQTYQNWEYIIVDNCSTDGSLEVARGYASKDSRIRVLENRGFLSAIPNHNSALRQISPQCKYCKIVFGDDWIFPECLELMVAVAEAHPTVGIVGAYGLEGTQVVWTGLPYPSTVVSGHTVSRRLFLDGLYVFGTATSVLYRADLVRNRDPFFDETDIHADVDVCLELLKSVDFGFVHQVLTVTRVREDSRIGMSRDFNTPAVSRLRHLMKYGPTFFNQREFKNCLQCSLAEYYWYLAGSVVRGRDRTFWEYHRRTLLKAGIALNRSRLTWTVFLRLCAAVLSPRENIKALLRKRSRDSDHLSTDLQEPGRLSKGDRQPSAAG